MKKRTKALIAILTPVITVSALAIAFFGCFFVQLNEPYECREDFNVEKYAKDVVSYTLDDTEETGKMGLEFSEELANSIIYSLVYTKLPESISKWSNGVYITIEDGYYYFVVKLKASFFETVVRIRAELVLEKDVEDILDSVLTFRVLDYQLGRIQDLGVLIHFGINKLKLQNALDSALSSLGFHFVVDLNHDSISYKFRDALDDLSHFTMGAGEEQTFFYDLFVEFLKQDITRVDFYSNKRISLKIDLTELGVNEIDGKGLNLDITNNVKNRIETLVDAGALAADKVDAMFQYFFHGYSHVGADTRSLVDATDFSSLGTSFGNPQDYEGFEVLHSNVDLSNKIAEQVTGNPEAYTKLMNGEVFAKLEENDIDSFLRNNDSLLGFAIMMTRDDEEEGFVNNYIALTDMYTNIDDTYLKFYVTMSFCGYELNVVLTTTSVDTNSPYEIKYEIDRIEVGEAAIRGSLGSKLLSYLAGTTGGNETFSITVSDDPEIIGYISLNFESSLDATYRAYIDGFNKKLLVTEADAPDGNGSLNLSAVDRT